MKLRDVPLSSLRSFVAAARWKTLSGAAEELGVTPGAVSRSVGKLEQWLGRELFLRRGRRLALTPTGTFLAAKIDDSLSEIMLACRDISEMQKRNLVTVDAPTSFAMYWLLPRLTELEIEVGDIDISLTTRLANQKYDGPLADIVITRGDGADGRLQGYEKFVLMEEVMSLLSSPKFAERVQIQSPEDVLNYQVIGSITRPSDWHNWMREANIKNNHIEFKHKFDHLFVALQAVRDGLGTIVAPRNIFVDTDDEEGDFRVMFPEISFAGMSYFVYFRSISNSSSTSKLVEYLTGQSRLTLGAAKPLRMRRK